MLDVRVEADSGEKFASMPVGLEGGRMTQAITALETSLFPAPPLLTWPAWLASASRLT